MDVLTRRERTYSWDDPAALAGAGHGLSGREFLERIGRSELPAAPAAATTGIEPVAVGDGVVVFSLEPHEWHYNPLGSVHGGILATLAGTC